MVNDSGHCTYWGRRPGGPAPAIRRNRPAKAPTGALAAVGPFRACCRKQLLRHAHFANKSRKKQWHSVKKEPAKAKRGIRSQGCRKTDPPVYGFSIFARTTKPFWETLAFSAGCVPASSIAFWGQRPAPGKTVPCVYCLCLWWESAETQSRFLAAQTRLPPE